MGDIRIADEVICIVASLAAQEVPGVVSMSGGLTDGINHFLGKENASKGVKLKFEGRTVNANVYINIEYGCSIPEIALEVQEKVKDAIEAMTGYDVQFVDVIVEGVAKRKATELEKGASSDETMADILGPKKEILIILLKGSWLIYVMSMAFRYHQKKNLMLDTKSFLRRINCYEYC